MERSMKIKCVQGYMKGFFILYMLIDTNSTLKMAIQFVHWVCLEFVGKDMKGLEKILKILKFNPLY